MEEVRATKLPAIPSMLELDYSATSVPVGLFRIARLE
jgi:hypothetical protein